MVTVSTVCYLFSIPGTYRIIGMPGMYRLSGAAPGRAVLIILEQSELMVVVYTWLEDGRYDGAKEGDEGYMDLFWYITQIGEFSNFVAGPH